MATTETDTTSTTTSELAPWERWRDALAGLEVRHPDRRSKPRVEVMPGMLPGHTAIRVSVDRVTSTRDAPWTKRGDWIAPLDISSVDVSFWPGEKLARCWFAAAWAGYCMHEALELVSGPDGQPPLDPHAEPYPTNPFNRCLRDAFPPYLDTHAMFKTLRLIMPAATAIAMLAEAGFDDIGLETTT